ncbi:HPr kinase/phosphorylase [Sphingorhabdus sp. EL138]|uniref:HPr kinase/phosphorylase n=1 Tax=Sphingorhabdus sp. EL138 TaxID=2073156 RepID=UPI0025E78D83|nr:HPr kinase/phosphatase C-terminal domain-containing protein [Sphingorhabdus sp. EL138]
MSDIVHGSAVAIDGNGVLLLGPSGSGKSDLALRLIDRGAKLICDDILNIENGYGLPQLTIAPNIAGKIEVRGIGICPIDFVQSAPLRLVVQLAQDVERMPPEHQSMTIARFSVPMFKLDPFQASSALKVEWALRSVIDAALHPVANPIAASNESVTM